MVRLDYLAIPVRDVARSREWHTRHIGPTGEFEVPERKTVALKDDGGFTVLELPSREKAVARAARIAKARRSEQEIRGFGFDPRS